MFGKQILSMEVHCREAIRLSLTGRTHSDFDQYHGKHSCLARHRGPLWEGEKSEESTQDKEHLIASPAISCGKPLLNKENCQWVDLGNSVLLLGDTSLVTLHPQTGIWQKRSHNLRVRLRLTKQCAVCITWGKPRQEGGDTNTSTDF